VKCVHLILSINALQHQTAGQFRASSRLPSSWYRSELFLRVKGKAWTILGRFQMISEHFVYPSRDCRGWSELSACSRKNGKNESTTSVNGNVPAAWIVKEFSAGYGTRSFLGDDALKFTVGVRRQPSSDRYTWIVQAPQTISTRPELSPCLAARKCLGNSLRRSNNEFVYVSELLYANCIRESLQITMSQISKNVCILYKEHGCGLSI